MELRHPIVDHARDRQRLREQRLRLVGPARDQRGDPQVHEPGVKRVQVARLPAEACALRRSRCDRRQVAPEEPIEGQGLQHRDAGLDILQARRHVLRLVAQQPRGCAVARHVRRDRGHRQGVHQRTGTTGFALRLSRPLEERSGRDRVDLQQGKEPAHEEAAGVRHRVARPHREELVQPAHAFRHRTRDPVPADVDGETGAPLGIPAQRASPEDPADVVDLDVHPAEPCDEPEPGLRRVPSTLRDIVVDAAELDGLLLARLSRLEAGELAHRLVQSIARDALDVVLQHQRLVDQR